MKKSFLLFLVVAFFITASAQNFTGQWKGEFTDRSTSFSGFGGEQCDYILELECKGTTVTGSSYTYFTDGGKKYYTICKLKGFIDPRQKYIEVKEVERTKTNVPVNIRNCFQVHKLTYFKHADTSLLEGKWDPAPGQEGDCGFGTTLLTRRELKSSFPNFNSMASKPVPTINTKINTGKVVSGTSKKPAPPVARKVVPAKKITTIPSNLNGNKKLPAPTVQKNNSLKKDFIVVDSIPVKKAITETFLSPQVKFEKRDNTVLKTIEVENKTVKVCLYDNGEVDGDSISLFYNGKLLLSGKKLSEKPITLMIEVEMDITNELVMYAENLGTIPPNTALMVVTDGAKRYEVRITSDLEKSGVINFVHKSGAK